jgi:glycogen(starch) synthase
VSSTAASARDAPRGTAAGPLRILAVGNMYPPHHAGGYELMWQAAMRRARQLGHTVRILTTDHREDGSRAEQDPDVHRTLRWYWDLRAYEFPRLNLGQRVAVERHNARELEAHLHGFAPDLVAWWSMGCMSLSLIERVRRAGLPAVSVVHDDWLVYGREHDQWIRIWRGRRSLVAPLAERLLGIPTSVELSRAGPTVFNSHYTRERALRAGVRSDRTEVIYPGIDARFLAPAPASEWAWRLVCIGRIDRQKGIDTAVRALAALPEATSLTVWGTGDEGYIDEMRGLAVRLGVADRLSFRGWADPARVWEAYRDADAVVVPVRWDEPFGLVPVEAMGVGRPVVCTARGGAAEFVIEGENALTFGADDPGALAAAVHRLAAEPALRAALVRGGQRTAQQYTIERFAQLTVEAMVRAGNDHA